VTSPTVADLIAAIERFIAAWNDRRRPFTWTKDPDTVIAKATTRDAARHQRRQLRSTSAASATRWSWWPLSEAGAQLRIGGGWQLVAAVPALPRSEAGLGGRH
jgi:hypothetical protein